MMESRPKSALSRLVNGLKREQHDYRASLDVFPALNTDKLAADLKLAQKCYQKVLELDPKHVEAQRELRLMGKAKS